MPQNTQEVQVNHVCSRVGVHHQPGDLVNETLELGVCTPWRTVSVFTGRCGDTLNTVPTVKLSPVHGSNCSTDHREGLKNL